MTIKKDAHGNAVQAARPNTGFNMGYSTFTVSQAFATADPSDVHINAPGVETVPTTHIRVMSTTDCYISFGNPPVAATAYLYLPAFTPEYFWVYPGEQIGAVQVSASGTLNVVELVS